MGGNRLEAFLPEPEPKLLRRDVCHTVLHFRVQPRLFTDSYSRAVNARAIPTVRVLRSRQPRVPTSSGSVAIHVADVGHCRPSVARPRHSLIRGDVSGPHSCGPCNSTRNLACAHGASRFRLGGLRLVTRSRLQSLKLAQPESESGAAKRQVSKCTDLGWSTCAQAPYGRRTTSMNGGRCAGSACVLLLVRQHQTPTPRFQLQ